MFATLSLERDPLKLVDVPAGIIEWVQIVGSFALLGLLIWSATRFLHFGMGAMRVLFGRAAPAALRLREIGWAMPSRWGTPLFRFLTIGAGVGYLLALALYLVEHYVLTSRNPRSGKTTVALAPYTNGVLTVAAACALLAVCVPFLLNLLELRWRRIWGIARLSFKEAVRRKVLYVFASILLIFLFLSWFVPAKRETQLQTYVTVVFLYLTPVLLVSSALIAAFGIPTDIKQQTIHTVITKPVERFEIVLGRFLGYTLLMSAALVVLTTLCLGYVLRGINPAAAAESLKARVPLYGELHFQKISNAYTDREDIETIKRDDRQLNVGNEWDYKRFIPGVKFDKETGPIVLAVWYFNDLPRVLTKRPRVRCEYTFDVFRQSKGKENEEISASFFFHTRYFNPASNDRANYNKLVNLRLPGGERERRAQEDEVRKLLPGISYEVVSRLSAGRMNAAETHDLLAERFGYHEVRAAKVVNFHTFAVDLPAGLFRNALNGPPGGAAAVREGAPLLTARVACESPSQFVGMARYDLYFRQDDPGKNDSDRLAFALNFYKGMLGLWMVMCLIIGLCVCLSTELSGIIVFLCVMLLYLGGLARSFILELAEGKNVGGGPAEASYRLFSRQVLAAQLEDTTLSKIATGSDEVFRWFVGRFLNILPDVDRYSFTDRVANGFDVGLIGQDLLPTLLLLLGYMFPWVLLAFYLIKSREIAGAN